MSLAIGTEQEQLADAVGQFARRHAPIEKTRMMFESIAAGELPPWWNEFVAYGFHAVHLPEQAAGQGGALDDLGCVIEAAAAAALAGPLLSTAAASAVALTAASGSSADRVVSDVAAGATAAIVLPEDSDFCAIADGDGWRLSGTSGLTLGMCSARWIVVPAQTDGPEELWFALDAGAADVNIESRRGTDLTTDVGVLRLQHHWMTADSVMGGVDAARARCLVASLAACASAGILRWCAAAATEYIRTREQFGKPIGTFQALQHKAAALFVNAELAAAAAWDAVHAANEPIEQHRLAAAAAVLMAVSPAPDLVLDALTMFGAIGYTWEHDIHLFWRRATSLAAALGPVTFWTREMGELVRNHRRTPSLQLEDADTAFRAEVAAVIEQASKLDNDGPSRQESQRPAFDIGPRRNLFAAEGLVAPYLPAPWGRGASPLQQMILAEEFAKRPELVQPKLGISEWILPTILAFGTDLQRERFAEPTMRGELGWCQLFSEPGAGSDLAALTTKATKVDGGWRINGQKVWTSLANLSEYGALLARTEPGTAKHRGISYFIVDMTSPGLEVRPIKQATGRAEFNEVYFTDVFVPDDMMVGQPGDGWNLAIATMAHERTVISNFVEIDRAAALRQLIEVDGPDQDAVLRTLGELDAYTNALKALIRREALRVARGQNAGPASSVAKYAYSIMLRRAATATLGMAGRNAIVEDSDPAVFVPYFDLPAELIGGGTAEIQLTIIAQMILGLPRK